MKVRTNARIVRSTLLITVSSAAMLLSGAAFAQGGAGGRMFGGRGGGNPVDGAVRQAQDQATRQAQNSSATQRAVEAFRRAAATRKAMVDAQAAARAAALNAQSAVRNGLGQGGLQVANGVALDPNLWQGANGPTQVQGADGRTNVTVDQTQQKAILTWDSFNVGRETDLQFKQGGADWVVLNRVRDIGPSRIEGGIKARGTVLILNQNGVLFGGASQVNVRNLVAAAATLSDDQFLSRGIYSQRNGTDYATAFADARGAVKVAAGARIATDAPASVTAGGGYVMLLGTEVVNEGGITTPKGQTLLAAGDHFMIRRGYGTEENKYSTTRGNEVRGLIDLDSASGTVVNRGLIEATQGDITLAGRTIRQDGVLVSTTGVNQRGTIHLLNSASDSKGSVTLGKGSLTLILPELDSKDTALDSQRDALIKDSETANGQRLATTLGGFDDRSLLADRLDQSRVEIVTGGDVRFEGGSQTSAQGGQVAVQAKTGRVTVADGARIDVSGVMGVALDMATNVIKVNVQGNEMRDSPGNRENDHLRSEDVWIDVRDLILLPSGIGGYEGDRWYVPGGLLEVGGYVGNIKHGIGEWAAVGGTITLDAREVIAAKGAVFDLSGGSIDYKAGYIQSSRVLGEDGRLYDLANAPANMKMIAWGNAFVARHDRWGVKYNETWSNSLFSGRSFARWEDGYTVGRDAGRLILSAPTAIMEADILAEAINGERQTIARADTVTDGYKAGQQVAARGGILALGQYDGRGRIDAFQTNIRIGDIKPLTASADPGLAIPDDRIGTVWLDATHLNRQKLGGLDLATHDTITVESDLIFAHGGSLNLVASEVDINATITARGGRVSAGNILRSDFKAAAPIVLTGPDGSARLNLHGVIDTRGLWTNMATDPNDRSGLAHLDGGKVVLSSTQDLTIAPGSVIDTSSGAAILENGKTLGGKGGDITIQANVYTGATVAPPGRLLFDGSLRSYGVDGGGTLTFGGSSVLIADDAADGNGDQLLLAPDFFRQGFSRYRIVGSLLTDSGITVAERTKLAVEMPVYRFGATAKAVATGADPADALEAWIPPLYLEDPAVGSFAQRKGASLALIDAGNIRIGRGAQIDVDPGQNITLSSFGQITVDGRLNAFGGTIAINRITNVARSEPGIVPGRSIWIGDDAVLDVAARATTAFDGSPRALAHLPNGGTIRIGVDDATPKADGIPDSITSSLIVIRPGARLDASGTTANGLASHGGSIALASSTGLVLDGDLRAVAGGRGAAGGSLDLILESGGYNESESDAVKRPRILTVTQLRRPSSLPADLQPGVDHAGFGYAQARLGVDQVQAGGFDNLSLWSADILRFEGDVALNVNQSLSLQRGVISVAETTPEARISFAAPVVRLDGGVRREISSFGVIRPSLRNRGSGNWLPASKNSGRLTVTADLIDIGNWVQFGASDVYDIAFVPGSGNQTTITAPIEAPGFEDIQLQSRGDIRLRSGGLATAGNMTLTAAQIYPVTGASASIIAGAMPNIGSGVKARPDSVLAIRSNGASVQTPMSVFGTLGLIAGTIDQGGIVRAPLGSIRLGGSVLDAGFQEYRSGGGLVLRDGSITSVSAAGLVIPYGGTVDGLKYIYNGRDLNLADLLVLDAMGKIEVIADRFEAAPGAILDLSGGGELAGAGFIAGRGGSVDILRTPLANANPAFGFSATGNKIYAIVPGFASGYAPLVQENGAGDPAIGQQITLGAGIPGLPAGTYTLLPSTHALLPGAYRVEIGAGLSGAIGTAELGNGSYVTGGYLGVANTAIRSPLPNQIVVTPGNTVRAHSQYNETTYSDFSRQQAARFGTTRGRLPIDGKQLILTFQKPGGVLDFKGRALFEPGTAGYAGTLLVQGYAPIEIKATDAAATEGMISLNAADLSRFNAGTLLVGGSYIYAGGGYVYLYGDIFSDEATVAVRRGAVLEAGQILLAGNNVSVEDGAVLDTTRSNLVVPDSTLGYVFANGHSPENARFGSVLVVANGWFNLLPAVLPRIPQPSRLTVADGAILRTQGTVGFVAADQLSLGQAQINARYLALSLPAVNVGTEATLAAANAAGVLGTGWNLTQTTLDRLLKPTAANLVPLERLSLSVRDAINFYGNVTLDARKSGSDVAETMVVLNTPAIYGWGDRDASAILAADTLVWNGIAAGDGTVQNPYSSVKPPAVQPGGAGTGSGRITFAARNILFGYDPLARTQNSAELERLALGFTDVAFIADEKVTANNRGSVSVYQRGTDPASYAGGNLSISTPLLTADSGAMIDIRAGGTVKVDAAGATADPAARTDLGGEIRLKGSAVTLDTNVVLPSGRLVLAADGDVQLGDKARIDLAGRTMTFFDATRYSWGGSLELESRAGSIVQAAGSIIDVSARNNDAGLIKAFTPKGTAHFAGTLRGDAIGGDAGSFVLTANSIADFADLNVRLNASGFFGERSFAAKSGDLVVGDGVKARIVSIAADGGNLIVNGRIDASGERVGTIRLSARDNLTLARTAVLDVHGTVLQTDSHGAAIDASNRGSVDLTTKRGVIGLAEGSTIDMRSADGVQRGRLEFNTPRVGDDGIAIDAANRINILGAADIAVNGFRNYTPSDGAIDQAYLDGIHLDSDAFVNRANANGALQARLTGLKAYGSAFHLRPGVEIVSDGDLATRGNLDLSGYRYGPGIDPASHGSGEAGVLAVRAGGNLKINGSISDGFMPDADPLLAPMLGAGTRSWSMRFVSGADLAASDLRAVRPLYELGEGGDLVLEDRHLGGDLLLEVMSAVRTGTGYLELLAGGDYRHASLFGVYTAGTALPEPRAANGMWFTDGGGDVRVTAGGTLAGYTYMSDVETNQIRIGNWLWRQDDAWGINFGAYALDSLYGFFSVFHGFSGIGALGGGNVHVMSGGDAGVMTPQTLEIDPISTLFIARSSGLEVAVGGSGYRDAGGALKRTGGGDLVMRIGGRLNAAPLYNHNHPGGGTLVNLRGDISLNASSIGLVGKLNYGRPVGYPDPRPVDPLRPYDYEPDGGITLSLGDSRAKVNTRGDLVMTYAPNPGIVPSSSSTEGFSLWTGRTAIDLFSAGGSVAPITSYDLESAGVNDYFLDRRYPPALGAVAGGGDVLVFGPAALTAAPNARLDLLARDSIVYGYNPNIGGNYFTIWEDGEGGTPTSNPMRFYALTGDIINIRVGTVQPSIEDYEKKIYIGGGPVRIHAGRDILVGGGVDDPASEFFDDAGSGGLIMHSRDTDISLVQAGRDIIYANFNIAGPGQLDVLAGRSIYQEDKGYFESIGPKVAGDTRLGAGISLTAGNGGAPDYGAIRKLYLDPANIADPDRPLADQEGKVVKAYTKELSSWLKERYGFSGGIEEGLALFDGLASEEQRIFLRQVYYSELREGGREYNDTSSSRFGSYLRGRQMIATLFPDKDAADKAIVRTGDIIMFGGSGVRTDFGGNIDMLVPDGQIVIGVQGTVPPARAGIVTQGSGDISLYSRKSILLGLSRIMTTFGGSIFGWSAEGDINAGRGAKTTVLFTPPRRTYDDYGNVALAPQVPSTGAGIATLNPIPEVPAGDVDLVAPLGTIDAGEAGIRVSGNINLAALQVLNAANIQVQGNAKGIPVAATVDTGALTAASTAASSVVAEAARLAERARPAPIRDIPSIITGRLLGFGE